ncbi:hydrogenase maturation nickel metallochaperone HypA [Bathymodiolus thermophilus thioautotrophic gill symbiont]|nr:hydrogenase maturation nickel metallochaperone HypA [Bathymodiolus thermophilus thioautotrophic gill symbiont]
MSIIESLEASAKENNYKAIEKVWLEVGPFSGVEVQALEFSFEVVIRDTIAHNAKLEVIQTQASAWCFKCDKTVIVKQRYDACPKCNSHQLTVTAGEELKIKQIAIKE